MIYVRFYDDDSKMLGPTNWCPGSLVKHT